MTSFSFSRITALIYRLSACASIPPVGEKTNTLKKSVAADQINWPDNYQPEKATFYVHNEIYINASPQKVWDILVDAKNWSSWYPGAFNVEVLNSPDGQLKSNSRFRWKTMGFDFTSVVKEYKLPYRLSWESRRGLIQGYHTWLIIPTENGSRIITDESQFGFLAYIQPIFVPSKLHDLHNVWLRELKTKAES